MVMARPRGCEHQVSSLHVALVALYRGMRSLAFQHTPHMIDPHPDARIYSPQPNGTGRDALNEEATIENRSDGYFDDEGLR